MTTIAEHNARWKHLPTLQVPVQDLPDDHPDHLVVELDSAQRWWTPTRSTLATVTLIRDGRRPRQRYEVSIEYSAGTVTRSYTRYDSEDLARAAFVNALVLPGAPF